jgi:cellulose synthase/poly-beta-1,6-N-acetylglucosamine synthase-like glycosyltransferase
MDFYLTLLLFIICLLYLILIVSYAFFFSKAIELEITDTIDNPLKVSVIIPARNEAHCIGNILNLLKNQTYPSEFIEIIIVDDDSTDDTYKIVNSFSEQNSLLNCKILRISENKSNIKYKKQAVSKAISISEGDLIITTDADCSVGPDWIKCIVSAYRKTNAKMLVGMVAYHNDNTVFEKMQHLEFLSLIASGIAAIQSGFPIMCNGANLIYEKKAYHDVNGFYSNDKFASGDDVFLLLKIKKFFGNNSIFALTDPGTLVYTQASKTLKDFTNQRLRWASKTSGYRDINILLVAGIVFVFNLGILICFLYGIIDPDFFVYALIMIVFKIVVDFPILHRITLYMNRKDLLKYYIPLQILYFPYILIIGVLSNFISYRWKGRIISK